jgi:membrane protease YdiL (CAAX protease family)
MAYVMFLLILGTLGWIGWCCHRETYTPSLTPIWLSWMEGLGLTFMILLISCYAPGIFVKIFRLKKYLASQCSDVEWMLLLNSIGQIAILLFLFFLKFKKIWILPRTWERCYMLEDVGVMALKAFLMLIPCLYLLELLWIFLSVSLVDHFLISPFLLEDQWLVQHFHQVTLGPTLWMFCLCTLLLAPILEELLFRYGLYRFLKSKWSARKSCWVTSGIFALVHSHWLSFVPLFGMSVFLIHLYERQKNLMPCIGVHMLFNLNTCLLLFCG